MYAIAVFGNRIIGFLNLLILAYLLSADDFGIYALMATNALVMQLIFGSWASASISKYVSISNDNGRGAISNAIMGIIIVMAFYMLLVVTYVCLPFAGISPVHVAIVLAWSLALAVYEVILSAENALHRPKAYALLALVRNGAALLLSVSAAWAEFGVNGAALGQVAGTLLPSLLLPSALVMWRMIDLRLATFARLREQVVFGLGGMIAFGFYVLFSMALRNMVGLSSGEAAAGRVSLATDLFYVPLALVINILFLGKMPRLYILSSTKEGRSERNSQLLLMAKGIVILTIPYMIAGYLIAGDVVAALLPGRVGEGIAPLAAAATVFGGGFALLYAATMILLIFEHRSALIMVSIGTILCNVVVLGFAVRLRWSAAIDLLWLATVIVLLCAVGTSSWILRREGVALPWSFWARIGIANAAMVAVLLVALQLGIIAIIAAALLGGALYLLIIRQVGAISIEDVRALAAYHRSENVPEANAQE